MISGRQLQYTQVRLMVIREINKRIESINIELRTCGFDIPITIDHYLCKHGVRQLLLETEHIQEELDVYWQVSRVFRKYGLVDLADDFLKLANYMDIDLDASPQPDGEILEGTLLEEYDYESSLYMNLRNALLKNSAKGSQVKADIRNLIECIQEDSPEYLSALKSALNALCTQEDSLKELHQFVE